MGSLEDILSVIVWPAAIIAFCFYHLMIGRLKAHHSEAWENLGRPNVFSADTKSSVARSLDKYLFLRKYRSLGDRRLSLYGNIASAFQYIAIAALVVWLVFITIPNFSI